MYDEDKNKLVKLFEMEKENGQGNVGVLQFSLMSYNNSPPKLQMVRRFQKRDGSTGYGKLGRMSKEEILFFQRNSEEMLKIIDGFK